MIVNNKLPKYKIDDIVVIKDNDLRVQIKITAAKFNTNWVYSGKVGDYVLDFKDSEIYYKVDNEVVRRMTRVISKIIGRT